MIQIAEIRQDEPNADNKNLAASLPDFKCGSENVLRRRRKGSTRKIAEDDSSIGLQSSPVGTKSFLYPELPKADESGNQLPISSSIPYRKGGIAHLRRFTPSSHLESPPGIEEDLAILYSRREDFTTSLPSNLRASEQNLYPDVEEFKTDLSALDLSAIKDAKDLTNLQRLEYTPPKRTADGRDSNREVGIATSLLTSVEKAASCFAKKFAPKSEIIELQTYDGTVSLQYTLETFTESRSTCWAYEPFMGQPIDGSTNGSAPGPWDIPVSPAQKFVDSNVAIEIPHTASIKPCHECVGIGRVRCFRCQGNGRVTCHHCDGKGRETFFTDGRHQDRSCSWCDGNGKNRCAICYAHGQVTCRTCEAKGQLKCFIRLTVTWTNHIADHIVERTRLPEKIQKGAHGSITFEEELPRVWPINHFPDQAINNASAELIRQHTSAYPSERILLQRQTVHIIQPDISEAHHVQKGDDGMYYMYGMEKQKLDPNYNSEQCCLKNCIIM